MLARTPAVEDSNPRAEIRLGVVARLEPGCCWRHLTVYVAIKH
jgi:hypothetical protein